VDFVVKDADDKKKNGGGGKSLVIVESPAKARTINRYLGSNFVVKASMGHVRDLPEKDLGIDLDKQFEPTYQTLADKKRVVSDLRKAANKAGTVYLATDLDREGEAIAWHLLHALELEPERARRVVFNEITKSAIQNAFQHPHDLDMAKVNAQQARRLLDRIVGYQLSPLLSAKIMRNLSAGRVQSVAVRLIVEREREIRAFIPEESWRVFAVLATDPQQRDALAEAWSSFFEKAKSDGNDVPVKERVRWLSEHACLHAELVRIDGKDTKFTDVDTARKAVEALGFDIDGVDEAAWEEYTEHGLKKVTLRGTTNAGRAPSYRVKDIQTRRTTSRPQPPFTTATLQQAASTNLGFGPARTMRVAQQLYEGVDLGGAQGVVGLITYMRTDSTNLSKDSVAAARGLIGEQYGPPYLPDKPNVFGRSKRAQEAHEAIRPSDVNLRPDQIKANLSSEQARLYDLIWRRFVACQMTPAQWDSTTVLVAADTPVGEAVFRSSGRRLVFDGFQRVLGTSTSGDVILPALEPGAEMGLVDLQPKQEYSSPPPRYTEASLVKKLEAEGIGRPSTYASIIQTVQDRGYVELLERKLYATPKGEIVTDKLVAHFPQVMDVKFTSYMEDELDKIEEAHLDWIHVLSEFYGPFKDALAKAESEMEPARSQPSPYTCQECGKPMVYRWGRNGRFLSCSGYPECTSAQSVDREGKPVETITVDHMCEKCGRNMVLRQSRRGPFLGCSGYPECDHTVPSDEQGNPLRKVEADELKDTCPECEGEMVVRFTRMGTMLGCSRYPKCKAKKPLPPGVYVEKPKPEEAGVRCDKCGRQMVIRKSRRGPFLSCSGFPRCRNAHPLAKKDELVAKEAAGELPPEPPPAEAESGSKSGSTRGGKKGKTTAKKVDIAALGPPPEGFAWTRTGRPVVETWPEGSLVCPDCGGEVTAKTGRFGVYFGCEKHPRCGFTANLRGEAKKRGEIEFPQTAKPKPIPTEVPCEECGANMVIRSGRSGKFLGCSKYPKCKATKPIPEGVTPEQLAVEPNPANANA
jgi:DNA topoisomerase-1